MALVDSAAVRSGRSRGTRAARAVWPAYALCSLLLVAYLASLIARSPEQRSELLDSWGIAAFELFVCALAFARAAVRGQRLMPLVLATSMSMWAIGDLVETIESRGGATLVSPSLADVFWIVFFPVAYLAIALMVRQEASRLVPALWLDGLIAGLGAAALSAAFAFRSVSHAAGDGAAAVVVNLAYPIGDVLLLALVVGGSAVLASRRRGAWTLVAIGCVINAVGDTASLLNVADTTQLGAIADGIAWPASLLLMSMAAWLRPPRADFLARETTPGFLLPALGGASALAVLLLGGVADFRAVAAALAAATLVVAGLRLRLSLGSLRRLTHERQVQALTDQLTGLGNRRRLVQVLDRFFAEQREPDSAGSTLAFLFVDLDHFKELNDSFGHSAGDQLLMKLGPRIERCLDESGLLIRIGGDEFAIVLIGADETRATEVARRVAAAIVEPFPLDMVRVQIGVSIGGAIAPGHATDAGELMHRADQAMYRAKASGSVFELYDPTVDRESDRFRIVEDLFTAIAERQFELHYQPQVDLRTGGVAAVEALLRWPHPQLGLIPPLEFLPLAEKAGLMRPLTSIVLDKALAQCAQWRREGRDLSVSINVSATNILDTDFTDLVRERLEQHGLTASALALEITETTVISDFDRCKRVIHELGELGCAVSIDDFGAGFTSLAHLGELAISELKLDRRFLASLGGGEHDTTLVRATIGLAHALGLRVVAEGIEDAATLEALVRLGCDLAQGYHLARPAPPSSLALPEPLAA